MNTLTKLYKREKKVNSLLCVGLDSDITKLPPEFAKSHIPQYEFNRWIIEQTHAYVSSYKPNFAFYEARGAQGWTELAMTMDYLHTHHPDIFTIADAKRGDIGNTNNGYVTAIFDELGFDAVTLHPYLGKEALQPFLDRKDKVSIILCKTSNPGSGEIQDQEIKNSKFKVQTVWEHVSHAVSEDWNANENCMLVAGATYPEEIAKIRKIVGDMTLLIPGIGAQGGDVKKTVQAGMNSQKAGMMINSARGIIFSRTPSMEARKLRDEINEYRNTDR